MATFTKVKLSGGTDGRNIKVVATATLGTTIHTAHASALDEIWLWAVNSDTTARKLTIEFGGVTVPDDLIEFTVPAEDGAYRGAEEEGGHGRTTGQGDALLGGVGGDECHDGGHDAAGGTDEKPAYDELRWVLSVPGDD